MKLSDFILPFLVSTVIHAGALFSDILHRKSEVFFEKGASAVTLNIVPSLTSKASSAIPAVTKPNVKQSAPAYPPSRKAIVPQKAILIKGSKTERYPSAKVSVQDKKDLDQRPHHRTGVAAVNSKNNDGDHKEKGVTGPVVVTGLSKPEYPRYSRINGEEGMVVLSLKVFANGRLGKIKVVSSSGYRRLDSAAVKALEKATFIPARVAGKIVASTKRIAFRFKLEDSVD